MENVNIQDIILLAEKAGLEIMKIYQKDFSIEYKDDKSPLTEADKKSNEIICAGLNETGIPVLSEEGKETPYEKRKRWKAFWLIDPIDGTKEFIKKNGEFTVNIALIENGVPVLGVVHVPVMNVTYYGSMRGGSFVKDKNNNTKRLPLKKNNEPERKLSVVASRTHMSPETQAFIDNLKKKTKQVEIISSGSSLKFCLVAEGSADVYPRLGPTMEWDTAAAHAVVENAGKKVLDFHTNQPLVYNKENLLNPWFIVQ